MSNPQAAGGEPASRGTWFKWTPWPKGVGSTLATLYFVISLWGVTLGPLFDAYLLVLKGQNTFVGFVESANGVSQFAFALPAGWLADKMRKTRLLRMNCGLAAVGVALLSVGIPTDAIPVFIVGSVLYSIHQQVFLGLLPVMLTDLTQAGDERNRVFSDQQTVMSLGFASGPALQLILTLATASGWTTTELHWALCVGLVLFIPCVACVFRIPEKKPPRDEAPTDALMDMEVELHREESRPSLKIEGEDSSDKAGESQGAGAGLSPGRRMLVAVLIEISCVLTAVGSGMTFKFWALFFKGDFSFSPSGVCAMQLSIWLTIAACAQITKPMARWLGVMPTVILTFYAGTAALFAISTKACSAIYVTIPLVLARNALMNMGGPLIQKTLMELVPEKHRGKWASLSSLIRMTWSGSAFLGGWLSDRHDYRFAFFITACVHSVSGSFLVVCMLLLRKRSDQDLGGRLLEETGVASVTAASADIARSGMAMDLDVAWMEEEAASADAAREDVQPNPSTASSADITRDYMIDMGLVAQEEDASPDVVREVIETDPSASKVVAAPPS